jgi:hypothetical protein
VGMMVSESEKKTEGLEALGLGGETPSGVNLKFKQIKMTIVQGYWVH